MKISQLILLSFFSVCYLFFGQTALAQQQNVREPEEYTLDLVVTQAPGDDGSIDVTWYSPENFNRFVVDFKDLVSGETRKLAVSGDNSLRIGDIDPLNQYSVSVTAVGDRDRSVGYSPKEIWSGKKVERLTGVRTVRQPVPLLFVPNLEATLRSLDSNNFPFIFTTIAVDTGGQPVGGLTKADFTAFEDGRVQTDFFEVTPPEEGGNVRILDFVFIIDNSLSMQAEQQEVKDNVKAFVDSLGARQIDVRLGLVRFGQTASGGQPIIMNNGNMTSDINFFKTLLDQMTVDGGFEPGLKAVFEAATTFSFRPGSQRHFLLITDEDSDGGNLAQTINTCQNNNIIVHTAVRCNFGNSNNDYCNSSSIRGATDGLLFNVEGPYRDILDSLIDPIGNTYIVRYRTDNPVFDGQQREVRIVINAFGQSDEVIGFYTPGAAPKIQRTQATINLSNSAQIAGIPLTIAAQITDAVAPFVQSATLYYRTTGAINYVSIPMSFVGNNIYEAGITGSDVQDPGVDYYITATDGQVTSSDPTVDPDTFPYQIAVLPNQPPQITHTPVTSGSPGQDILISATVIDNTISLTSIDLHYREISTLLFQHVSMAAVGGDQYEGFIPNSVVTNAGVEYFIRAVDDFGLASIHGIHTIIISDTSECAPLFFDDFEDSNADGWTPLNSLSWVVKQDRGVLAYCLIDPNNPPGPGRLGEYSISNNINSTDFIFECRARSIQEVSSPTRPDIALLYEFRDDLNYSFVKYNKDKNQTNIQKLVNGVSTKLVTSDGTIPVIQDFDYHDLKITRQSGQIEVFYDNMLVMTAVDPNPFSGNFGVGSANDGACFDNVSVAVSDCPTTTLATITIPKGLQVPAGSRLTVPVIVSTQKNIGLAQFTIEYNDGVLEFDQATIGTDAPGFAVSQLRRNPPFAPTTPGTNNNFIVQISGGGTNSFSGNDKVVVLLDFNATGNVGDTTPLAIDTDCSHTFLTTTDFDDICGDQITVNNGEATIIPTSEISGHVLYYFDSSPVINSSLKLTGATQFTQITDANGFYQFSNIAPDNYTLTPSKNDDHRAAIKGSDALLLMRYLAFLDTLSNEQLTAADVTQSGTITGSDVVALLRFLAFFTSNIAETGDWIFVPPSVSVNIPPSSTQDFQAFLLGDITGDWGVTMATNQLAKLNKSEGELILERVSVAGSPDVRVPVFLQSSHHSIHSLLFSIAFDTSQVHLKAVENNAALKDYMIVVNDTEPGKLHIAAVGLQPIPSHQAILNLAFEVQNKQIGAHERGFIPITFSRALLNDKNVAWVDGGIELTSATAKIPDRFELLQNYPNPFNLATTIRFGVPQVPLGMTHIILDIYNVNGQKVKRLVDEEKPPGYYSIQWDGRDNNGRVVSTGIYFYTFRAEKVQFSQKLLLIK